MLQLGIRGLGIARFKFNPISWFLKGEPGAWYDPSDLTTLFQDSAGTTPVTAVEQPVGLMLDKSRGLALGAELVTNGDFSNGTTGWTQSGTGEWIFTNGKAECTAGTGDSKFYQICFNTNKYYVLEFDLTYTSGILQVNNDGVINLLSYSSGTTSGRKRVYFYPSAGQTLGFRQVGFVGSVDNISVKQIAGNHAFQSDTTPGKRPMLSARVNLLTKTEDFSDAVWAKAGVTATSDSITSAGSVAYTYKDIGANLPATAYSLSCKVKAGTNNFVALNIQGNGTYWATIIFSINPLSPSVGESVVGAGIGITISNTSISLNSDGYFTISAVVTCATSVLRYFGVMFAPLLTGNTFVSLYGEVQGNPVGKTIFTKQADLRPTNAGALLPPYQRVNTASDYDTVGFPLYLKANGTSSAMSTNSIDFTSTDKMTVVTGVRKLSDATRGMISELSASLDANTGSFNVSSAIPNATANYRFETKGTLASSADCGTGFIAPVSSILTGQSFIASDSDSMRVNGVLSATSPADQGSGTYGNYPLYLFARAGTSLFLNGQFYGAVIRGAQSDTASVTQTEQYMATKTGITF